MIEDANIARSLRRQWRTWGLRFYAGAFLAFALLAGAYATRHDQTWRIAFKTLASLVGIAAVVMGVVSVRAGIRARRLRRNERNMVGSGGEDVSLTAFAFAIRTMPGFGVKVLSISAFFVGTAVVNGVQSSLILTGLGVLILLGVGYPLWRRRGGPHY